MFMFDFENKENRFSEPFYPTDHKEADFKFMRANFKGEKEKFRNTPRLLIAIQPVICLIFRHFHSFRRHKHSI